jgi:hypothetical protein
MRSFSGRGRDEFGYPDHFTLRGLVAEARRAWSQRRLSFGLEDRPCREAQLQDSPGARLGAGGKRLIAALETTTFVAALRFDRVAFLRAD